MSYIAVKYVLNYLLYLSDISYTQVQINMYNDIYILVIEQ